MSSLQVVDLSADRVVGEVVAALFFEDVRPVTGPGALLDWRLNGLLTDLLVQGKAHGRAGENILFRSNGKLASEWIFFVGGGSWQGLGEETYRGLIRHLLAACWKAGFACVALCLAPLPGMGASQLERLVAEVLDAMGAQRPDCRLSLAD